MILVVVLLFEDPDLDPGAQKVPDLYPNEVISRYIIHISLMIHYTFRDHLQNAAVIIIRVLN